MGNNSRRDGYNASARQSFRPAKRVKYAQNVQDTNAEMVIIKSKEQKENDRKERLKLQLMEETNSKLTTKKKLRLEKYIEKKLKKEDRELLFQKLAKTQAGPSISLSLQSSSILGSGKNPIGNQNSVSPEDRWTWQTTETHIGKGGSHDGRHDYVDFDRDFYNHDRSGEFSSDNLEVGLSNRLSVATHDEDVVEPPIDAVLTKSRIVSNLKSATPLQKPRNTQNVRKLNKGVEIKFTSWTKGNFGIPLNFNKKNQSTSSIHDTDDNLDEKQSSEGETSPTEDTDGDDDSDSWAGMDSEPSSHKVANKRKRDGFKDWAVQQLHIAQGNASDGNMNEAMSSFADNRMKHQCSSAKLQGKISAKDADFEKRGPLGDTLEIPNDGFAKSRNQKNLMNDLSKVAHTPVVRSAEIQAVREMLPIFAEEQPIVEAIRLNPVVIICGETGSGKTTQVPQFLYEAGFANPNSENPGMIGITQPRRVAAMSMAARVSHELSLPSFRVSYQIRYDATVSPLTSIKFMTDGVLLRELATDFVLSKYSVIIIDEAHERSLNTDILIGVLSRVIKLREEMHFEGRDIKPLRLVIMSATMRVNDFLSNKSLFSSDPPVINISSRQYPVTIHFSRRTTGDYVSEAVKKASRIHCRLPAGGILIFLTGRNEISGACARLEAKFGKAAIESRVKRLESKSTLMRNHDNIQHNIVEYSSQVDIEAEDMELLGLDATEVQRDLEMSIGEETEASESEDGQALDDELGVDKEESDVPMFILPLYSLLSNERQMRVFQLPPVGSRLVIIATNVAETSLTIPGIRYVIDCGRVKERRHDPKSGVQSFHINWISKASAAQRAGRAGRIGPGHCYRLYSSSLFEHYFVEYTQPEIIRTPIESVVLQMKNMHIDTISNFPFPTQPENGSLRKAEQMLIHLGALSHVNANATSSLSQAISGNITDIGRAMALFPLSPRFSKLLINGRQHGCLPYIIAIVSAISSGDPFVHEQFLKDAENVPYDNSDALNNKEVSIHRRRKFFKSREHHHKLGNGSSDIFPLLSVVGAYEYAGGGHQFCEDHFVQRKTMEEIHKLRVQISNIVQHNFPDTDIGLMSRLKPPDDLQCKVLRQLMCSAFIDQVAIRKDLTQQSSTGIYATAKDVPYRAMDVEEDVFIHSSSTLFNRTPPDYIIFQEILRSGKLWIKYITVVNPVWLAVLGKGSLCSFSKPRKNMSGEKMVLPRFGTAGWELPAMKADTLHL